MYARVSLKRRWKNETSKEWRTCDRCGAEIKKGILCGNSVTRNGILNTTYDLCPKCMEDFERFMRNEKNIDNPLSEYQPPSKEAMINFGIDISREVVEKMLWKSLADCHKAILK